MVEKDRRCLEVGDAAEREGVVGSQESEVGSRESGVGSESPVAESLVVGVLTTYYLQLKTYL